MSLRMGELLAEDREKIIRSVRHRPDVMLVEYKKNGEQRQDLLRFLQKSGVPTVFIDRLDKDSFWARQCTMVPYTVIFERSKEISEGPNPPLPRLVHNDPAYPHPAIREMLEIALRAATVLLESGRLFAELRITFGTDSDNHPLLADIEAA